jgi:hypothetical protein
MVTHYNYIENKLQAQSELREGLLSEELFQVSLANNIFFLLLTHFTVDTPVLRK